MSETAFYALIIIGGAILLGATAIITIREFMRLGKHTPDPQDRNAQNVTVSLPDELYDRLMSEQVERLNRQESDSTFSSIVQDALRKYLRR